MAFSERLALIISANADQAIREIRKVGAAADKDLGTATERADRFANKSLAIGAGLVAAGGVALPMLARLGQGASDLNEQISASGVIFEDNARDVQAWSSNLDRSFGISQKAALTAANNFGALFTGVGLAGDEATEMSRTLVELSSDLSSFKNLQGGAAEATERLRSGLAGEAEPLRRLDIFLNEAAVSAKAMELGIAGAGDKLTDSQKIQARYALILEQSTKAQGDFARTSDSLANSQRIAAAEAENAANAFGQGVVGPMTAATKAIGGTVRALGELSPEAASTVGTVLTIGAATSVAVGGLALLSGGVIKARLALRDGETGLNNFGKAAKGLGVASGIAAGVFAIKGGLDALGVSVTARNREFEKMLGTLDKVADRDIVSAFERIADVSRDLAVSEFFDKIPLAQQQRLVVALRETGAETADLEAKIKARAKAEAEGASSTAAATKAVKDLTGATEDGTDATGEAADAERDLAEQRERVLEATIASINSERAYHDALSDIGEAERRITEAEKDLAEARKSGDADKAADAQRDLADANRDLVDEYINAAEAAQRFAEDQATAAGQTVTAADSYRVYRDELIRLKDSVAPGSPLRRALEELINKLPPPEVKFKVVADTAAATAALEALRLKVAEFNKANPGAIGPSQFGPLGGTAPAPATAAKAPPAAPTAPSPFSAGFTGPTSLSKVPRFHSGGLAHPHGAGTHQPNEMPALLEVGEFVIPKKTVQRVGTSLLAKLIAQDTRSAIRRPFSMDWPAPVPAARGFKINPAVRLDTSQVEDRRFHDGGAVGTATATSATPDSAPSVTVNVAAGAFVLSGDMGAYERRVLAMAVKETLARSAEDFARLARN